MDTTYRVELKKSAKKEFDKLPTKAKARILEALRFLGVNPFSELLDIKKLRTPVPLYRLRVGDYRIVYEVLQNQVTVTVIKIGHRREVYRR